MHKLGVIHRNLKPRKVIVDWNLKKLNLYLIDFKYAKKFKHKNGKLLKYTESLKLQNKSFCNKFSSIGTHLGISIYTSFFCFYWLYLFTSKNQVLAPKMTSSRCPTSWFSFSEKVFFSLIFKETWRPTRRSFQIEMRSSSFTRSGR